MIRISVTPEIAEFYQLLAERLVKVYPDFTGPITPEESVKLVTGLINNATAKDTGAFISHKGNKEWV